IVTDLTGPERKVDILGHNERKLEAAVIHRGLSFENNVFAHRKVEHPAGSILCQSAYVELFIEYGRMYRTIERFQQLPVVAGDHTFHRYFLESPQCIIAGFGNGLPVDRSSGHLVFRKRDPDGRIADQGEFSGVIDKRAAVEVAVLGLLHGFTEREWLVDIA